MTDHRPSSLGDEAVAKRRHLGVELLLPLLEQAPNTPTGMVDKRREGIVVKLLDQFTQPM